jgi:hypothetical protein
MAYALPIDADGPSGVSDNADLDDLIVSFTSPTAAAVAFVLVLSIQACLNVIVKIAPARSISVHYVVPSSVEGRAPPLV